MEPWLKIQAVAAACDVTVNTIERWSCDPSLAFPKAVKIGNRRYWTASDLAAWREKRKGTVVKLTPKRAVEA